MVYGFRGLVMDSLSTLAITSIQDASKAVVWKLSLDNLKTQRGNLTGYSYDMKQE
jgi:hypothetical protein